MFNQTGLVFARLFSVGMVQHSAAEPGDLDVILISESACTGSPDHGQVSLM